MEGQIQRSSVYLEGRARELETLFELVRATGSAMDEKKLIKLMAQGAARACGVDRCSIFLWDESGERVVPVMCQFADGTADLQMWETFRSWRNLMVERIPFFREAVQRGEPVLSPDAATDPLIPGEWVKVAQLRSVLTVPLIQRDRVIGVLVLDYMREPHPFTSEQVRLAMTLAGQIALVLVNARLYVKTQEQLKQSETLLAVSRTVSTTLDVTETMRRVAREIARALGADMVGAFLAGPDQKSLRPIAGYHVPKQLLDAFKEFPIPLKGHRALEEAWEHHRPVYASDAQADPRFDRETIQRFPVRSVLFFPMILNGKPIGGVFVVWWEQRHDFTSEELRLLEGISHQAAIAIDNARLFEETQRRQREAEVLHEIARAINASLDLDTVLQRIAAGARESSRSDYAQIALLDPVSGTLRVRHRVEARYQWYDALTIEPGKGVGGLVLLTGCPFRTDNYVEDPRISKDYLEVVRGEGIIADLAVPIWIGGRVEGVLFVANRSSRPFTDRDEAVLQRLVEDAALAIGNARLLEELKCSYEEIRRAQEHLVQAEKLRALGQLAGGIAHEIRNPLAITSSAAQILLKKGDDPELRQECAEKIRSAANRAGAIIENLLRFARPSEGLADRVHVNDVLEETFSLIGHQFPLQAIEIDKRFTPGLPTVRGNQSQLQQVFMNIVFNAYHAMPEGGRLTIESRLAPATPEPVIEVRFTDTGRGISQEHLPRIFEPFFTTMPVGQGTGLGLSTAYSIVQQHGGWIGVESQVGKGSTFTVALPVEGPDA